MESNQSAADPIRFLASLERRHEEIFVKIDELADRIEKVLLEYKPPTQSIAITAGKPSNSLNLGLREGRPSSAFPNEQHLDSQLPDQSPCSRILQQGHCSS